MTLRIGIIGLGPWGLCALERVITTARADGDASHALEIHIVEPRTPGSGVYDTRQPDYLLLNNPCGQLSLYPFADADEQPRYAVGLHDWAVRSGYRWVGDRCVIDSSGNPIESHHFLPRRVMGEYLKWFYETLVHEAPSNARILHHQTSAVDIIARVDGTELICLEDSEWLLVDHVIVTSGHTPNERQLDVVPHHRQLSPFPVSSYVNDVPTGAKVAVSGMGLVAVDVVTALTVGRGGGYTEAGDGLRYRPSGREPVLHLYSRSGLPFTAKSVTSIDRTDVYAPIVCTPQAIAGLTEGPNGGRRRVDLRNELLPLMFAEMYVRYYAQAAFQVGGLADGAAVRERLAAAWSENTFEQELRRLRESYGRFDAEELFFGATARYASSDDYESAVYGMIESDLGEAQVDLGYSPIKSAAEVFRIFRDPMRSVVEHGGLSLDSYLDFNADIRSRITRLVAGPPALRSRQFLALMDAGVLRIPFGPAPALGPGSGLRSGVSEPGLARLSSTLLGRSHSEDVDLVVRGHLEDPRIEGSASVLLNRLYEEGRVSQFRYGNVTVGSVDLTSDAHPIDIHGRPQERIWMFGVLTEGVRHFTHYIPSPKSRIRAFEDIGSCVAAILGSSP
jgi:hypothetical protein